MEISKNAKCVIDRLITLKCKSHLFSHGGMFACGSLK